MAQLTPVEQYQQQLRDSFLFFLVEVWRLIGLPAPSRIQLDVAKWLQTGPSRRGIIGFRGLSKTWITAAYICWRLYKNKDEKILLVSAGEDNAKKTLLQVRGWIGTIPFLKHLVPDRYKDSDLLQRDNTEMFDVAGCKMDRIASVTAMGVTGALPGGRATLIIPDDVEQLENTITRAQRERLKERVTEFECILVPGGDIVYLGTYHHIESLYDALQRGSSERQFKPYRFRNWPIQYPQRDEMTSIIAPMLYEDLKAGKAKPGDPVWPQRFSRDYIMSLVMGKTTFQQQYMGFQDPGGSTRYPLKLQDLIVYPINKLMAPVAIQWGKHNSKGSTAVEDIPSPGFGDDQFYGPCMISSEWVRYVGCKGYCDPAGAGEDEWAWSTGGQLHGYIFVKTIDGFKGGPTEANLDRMVLSLREDHCHELYVEDTFGGTSTIRLIENAVSRHSLPPDPKSEEYPNGWSCAVIPRHAQGRGQKELRIISALEPVMSHHRLVIDPACAKECGLLSYSVWYQMVNITRERDCLEHDDRLEVLAGMVNEFSDAMGQNPAAQEQRRQEIEREKHLQEFYRQFGVTPPARTWSGISA